MRNKEYTDFDSLSDENKIDYLSSLICEETKKEKCDENLISECLDYIALLNEDKSTDKTLHLRLSKIKRNNKVLKASLRYLLSAVVIIAALFSVLTVFAKKNGYDSTLDFLSENIAKILALDVGDSYKYEDIEASHYGSKPKIYVNINDFYADTGIKVLYPYMENEIEIKKIYYIGDNKQFTVIIEFSDLDIKMEITNFCLNSINQSYRVINLSGNEWFYKYFDSTNTYQAVCHIENKEYCISTSSEDKLMKMIKNMKDNYNEKNN